MRHRVHVKETMTAGATITVELADGATEAEVVAKGHRVLQAMFANGPDMVTALEAQQAVTAHFAHCDRGCGFDHKSGGPFYCVERQRLALVADTLAKGVLEKVRAAR